MLCQYRQQSGEDLDILQAMHKTRRDSPKSLEVVVPRRLSGCFIVSNQRASMAGNRSAKAGDVNTVAIICRHSSTVDGELTALTCISHLAQAARIALC
jgi:hypothetical protein